MFYNFIKKTLLILGSIGDVPENTDREKVGHGFLIYTGLLMSLGGLLWGGISFYSGLYLQSLIPFGYTAITIVNFIILYYSKWFNIARNVQMTISVFLPVLFQLSLGGFVSSGAVILWSILSILVGFTFQNRVTTFRWFLLYIILIIVCGLLDNAVLLGGMKVSNDISILFFVLNLSVISAIIFTMFFYFVKHLETLRAQLVQLANTDALTNIPNRRHIFEIIEKEFKRVKRNQSVFSVMMMDIDFFKKVNDTFGHAGGDDVLKCFSGFLTECTRQIDSIGRYGGEEFIVLLPETSLDEALVIGNRINDKCRDLEVSTPTGLCNFTVSIGITVFINEDTDINNIIKRADEALYEAKAMGRDQVNIK